ncbi:hypothetical protein IWQ60_002403 [Tieghemiomyces parasiticus]|uniref:AB hydrolase-1 domain-containing protein n=1 Tax=Tieghemiomyces parasiticus TaxID=78921 RepID=A0A9W8ABC9_9FUNG|nr:hypothetical protein IWQ60_002403 [Tieghemiomyces parasiticus]
MRHKSTILSIPGVIALLFLVMHLVALIVYSAKATNDVGRTVPRNEYADMWINVVGFFLTLQALFVVSREYATTRVLNHPLVWIVYSAFVVIASIMLFAGYVSIGQVGTAIWALTLLGGGVICLIYSMKARRGYFVDSIMDIPHHRLVAEKSALDDLFHTLLDTVFFILTLLFVFVFLFFLVFQGIWLAADRHNYPAPGSRVDVSVNGTDPFALHVYCQGPANPGKATYLVHNEEGTPMTALMALQISLANRNRRVCLYDRPGYGWSDPGYVAQRPEYVVNALKAALDSLKEKGPYILLGYGAGGEYAQLFSHIYPTQTAGVGLIDSFPNREYLLTYAMNQTTTEFYDDYTSDVSHYFQSRRVISPLGWQRPIENDFPGFHPASLLKEHISLYSTNNHWQGRYFEYDGCGCRAYQSLQGFRDSNTTNYLRTQGWPLTWPALPRPLPVGSPDLPLLIVTANQTLNASCNSDTDAHECEVLLAQQNVFRRQLNLYAATLSENVRSVVCPGRCDHNMVYTSADWLSGEIVNWFK